MSLKPEKILVCTQNPKLMSLSKAEISFVSFADIVKGRDANVRTYNNEFCAVDISSVMSGKGINYAGEVCFFSRFCHANCVINVLLEFATFHIHSVVGG